MNKKTTQNTYRLRNHCYIKIIVVTKMNMLSRFCLMVKNYMLE